MDSKFSKHLPKYNMLFWFMELEEWEKKKMKSDKSSAPGSSVSIASRLMAIKKHNFVKANNIVNPRPPWSLFLMFHHHEIMTNDSSYLQLSVL